MGDTKNNIKSREKLITKVTNPSFNVSRTDAIHLVKVCIKLPRFRKRHKVAYTVETEVSGTKF